MNTDTKLWKKVTYPGVRENMYLVSEDGEIMNAITLKLLTPYYTGQYLRVNIAAEGRSSRGYSVFIHRIVAYAFTENPYDYPIVDHIDGDKLNNHYSNLEWVTYRENNLRARRNGLISDQGYKHSSSIFTEELARSICEKLQDGWLVKDIFRWICKNPTATPNDDRSLYQFIQRLRHRYGWENVTSDYTYSIDDNPRTGKWDKQRPGHASNGYSEDEIRAVCQYLEDGKSVQDILEIFTGSRLQKENRRIYDFIDGIRRGLHWTEISCEYKIGNNTTPTRNNSWDESIPDLVDAGYSKREIREKFGIYNKTKNRNAACKIDRMVDRYLSFKAVHAEDVIIVDE